MKGPILKSVYRTRGYIPHFDSPGQVQFITFRLADALPFEKRAEWEDLLAIGDDIKRYESIEKYLDAANGACYLRDPRVAKIVQQALLHFHPDRYRLIAWVVMPNHVHVLIEVDETAALDKILHSWKSYTAKEANRIFGRKGVFWQKEYFDRYIRSQEHMVFTINYIHNNPVSAGLVDRPEEWSWSSAKEYL